MCIDMLSGHVHACMRMWYVPHSSVSWHPRLMVTSQTSRCRRVLGLRPPNSHTASRMQTTRRRLDAPPVHPDLNQLVAGRLKDPALVVPVEDAAYVLHGSNWGKGCI